jgi:hypothetical protein
VPAPDRPAVTVEALVGQRVVDDPASLDAILATLPGRVTVLRFAPDEALILDGGFRSSRPAVIVEDEVGFVAVTVDADVVARHTDWSLPGVGSVAQGAVAGVPAKVARLPDGRAWIVTQAAYLADLLDRLT